MLRSAFAVAALLLVLLPTARAGDLLPADRPIAEVVDHYIDEALRKVPLKAAPRADAATLIRRLSLDLDGRIPTADELRSYIESTAPDKLARLVDRLMASPAFVRHQATELDTMLMAGSKGSLREYLLKAAGLKTNPGTGSFRDRSCCPTRQTRHQKGGRLGNTPVKDLERPRPADSRRQLNFLRCEHQLRPVPRPPSGARLETRPLLWHEVLSEPHLREWKRQSELPRRARLWHDQVQDDRRRRKASPDDVLDRPPRGRFQLSRHFQGRSEKGKRVARPRSKKDKVPPPAPKFSARSKLVELALGPGDRDFFSRAIVNRIWYRLFGHGLVMPLDQMHSANPPSHPELLAWLGRDLSKNGYDLRRLIRGLVLSETYSRSSRWQGTGDALPVHLFAVALARPLTPTQLATSLRMATADSASFPPGFASEPFEMRIESLEASARSLASSFATSSGDTQIGVAEALFFSNGKRVSGELLSDGAERLLSRLGVRSASALRKSSTSRFATSSPVPPIPKKSRP